MTITVQEVPTFEAERDNLARTLGGRRLIDLCQGLNNHLYDLQLSGELGCRIKEVRHLLMLTESLARQGLVKGETLREFGFDMPKVYEKILKVAYDSKKYFGIRV